MNVRNCLSFLLLIILISACRKDIEIGADLLSDQEIGLSFTDTFNLKGQTVLADPIRTWFNSSFFSSRTHMVGRLEDPLFGVSEGIAYFNAFQGTTSPDFSDATLDSVVLVILLDTVGSYGNKLATQNIEVYQMDTPFQDIVDGMDTLFTDQSFSASTLIGTASITPSYSDSFNIFIPISDTIIETLVPYHLRVRLDDGIGEELLMDSTLTQNDTTFQSFLKGFKVVTDGSVNGMIGLNLNPAFAGNIAGFNVYYTKNDDMIPRKYTFLTGEIRHNEHIHDYNGSPAESALNDSTSAEYMYVQSMTGVNTSFNLTGIENYTGSTINKAELELTHAFLPSDDIDLYPTIDNLFISYENEEGDLASIFDVSSLYFSVFNSSRDPVSEEIEAYFGGNEEEVIADDGRVLKKYKFNITNHVKSIIDGTIDNPHIVLESFAKPERPNRVVFYGPLNPDNDLRARLKLIITEP